MKLLTIEMCVFSFVLVPLVCITKLGGLLVLGLAVMIFFNLFVAVTNSPETISEKWRRWLFDLDKKRE